MAGEITLKVSGREVTVKGQQAIDALRNNQSFKTVGVALRNSRPTNEVLRRAAERLTDITGDTVIPLEDDISKAATKALPQLQLRYGPLATRLASLGLPGAETVDDRPRSWPICSLPTGRTRRSGSAGSSRRCTTGCAGRAKLIRR